MRYILLIIVTLLALEVTLARADVEATENADGSVTFTLPADRWAACQAQGGCVVVSMEQVEMAIRQSVAHQCGRSL